jgi:hypothetical protein
VAPAPRAIADGSMRSPPPRAGRSRRPTRWPRARRRAPAARRSPARGPRSARGPCRRLLRRRRRAAGATAVPPPAGPGATRAAGAARSAELGAADDVAAVRVLVDVRRDVPEGVPVVPGGVGAADRAVLAVPDEPRRGGGGVGGTMSAAKASTSGARRADGRRGRTGMTLTGSSGGGGGGAERRREALRPGGEGVRSDVLARGTAQPGPQVRVGVQAAEGGARAPGSPAGTTRPLRSWRTSPPAAAPTAVVAMTGRPRCMASLQTRPHGSRKVGVGTDGTTRTAAERRRLRTASGACGPSATTPAWWPHRESVSAIRWAASRSVLGGNDLLDVVSRSQRLVRPLLPLQQSSQRVCDAGAQGPRVLPGYAGPRRW